MCDHLLVTTYRWRWFRKTFAIRCWNCDLRISDH